MDSGDHFIPRRDGFRDGGSFVLARRRNRGAELPAHGADHSVDDFVAPVRRAVGAATNVGFGATGAMSMSHDWVSVMCLRITRESVRNRLGPVNPVPATLKVLSDTGLRPWQ
jgi:hypothetical protein